MNRRSFLLATAGLCIPCGSCGSGGSRRLYDPTKGGNYKPDIVSFHWEKSRILYRVEGGAPNPLGSKVRREALAGFAFWYPVMQYLGIEYREAQEGEEADALIKWARVSALGGDFWGGNQTLGRTDRKLDGKVIRSTVTFLDSQLWTIGLPRLRYIAGHEAGHVLGIGGHSRSAQNLMGIPVPNKAPTQEDFNTLALGYPERILS